MKKSFFLIVFFIAAIVAHAQIPSKAHPRLIFTEDVQKMVVEKLKTDPQLMEFNQRIIDYSDQILTLPELKRIQEGRRILSVSREALQRTVFLAYSYRMTGDKKYLKKAVDDMLAVSAFTDWNPSHFLDVAEMTTACAFGYDWLYNSIDPASRKTIENAIIEKGLKASVKNDSWKDGNNNWNQVCNGGMVMGALAVYEGSPELSQKMLERADTSLAKPLDEYNPDGAYPEGANYWNYGTSFNLILLDALKSVYGNWRTINIPESFYKSSYFMLHAVGSSGYLFNYSDGGLKDGLNPSLFWFAAQRHDNSILWYQTDYLKNFLNRKPDLNDPLSRQLKRFDPFIIIWTAQLKTLQGTQPTELSWMGHGINPVAMHRTGWNSDDIFIGIKGGSPSSHHAHMDAGSFVMDALGTRWAVDLGMHDYHKLESQGLNIWGKEQNAQRWTIKRYSNYFHNTLTVDNGLQLVTGKGEIVKHKSDKKLSFTIVDITSLYKNTLDTAVRGIAIADGKYVLVHDEIKTNHQKHTVRWSMITYDDISIRANEAIIKKDGKTLTIRVVSPKNAVLKTWTTDPQNSFEDKNPGTQILGFETEVNADTQQNMDVLLIPGNGQISAPQIKSLKDW